MALTDFQFTKHLCLLKSLSLICLCVGGFDCICGVWKSGRWELSWLCGCVCVWEQGSRWASCAVASLRSVTHGRRWRPCLRMSRPGGRWQIPDTLWQVSVHHCAQRDRGRRAAEGTFCITLHYISLLQLKHNIFPPHLVSLYFFYPTHCCTLSSDHGLCFKEVLIETRW